MKERRRRLIIVIILALMPFLGAAYQAAHEPKQEPGNVQSAVTNQAAPSGQASETLAKLEIKGKAPKTGYTREQFSDGWADGPGCNVRNFILKRDMTNVVTESAANCNVVSGTLQDPYTNKTINFVRGASTSDDVQIDHVVALSNAWQTGAQQLSKEERFNLANDPLELLAVDGPTNQKKGDGDAATWLPPNKDYRCRYVARQIAVKSKYALWVTQAEHDAMVKILNDCPGQILPVISPN